MKKVCKNCQHLRYIRHSEVGTGNYDTWGNELFEDCYIYQCGKNDSVLRVYHTSPDPRSINSCNHYIKR
jgi:hypothetical protein